VFYCYAHPTLLPCSGLKLVTAAGDGGYCRLGGETTWGKCEIFMCTHDYMSGGPRRI